MGAPLSPPQDAGARPPASPRSWRDAVAEAALWLACTFTCIHALYTMGFEGPWLLLDDTLLYRTDPPFRHRVLFVELARGIGAVFPAFHPPRLYFLTQFLAAALAFWAIQPWAARFVPHRIAVWSRPLLLVMLVPTFTYWTFYDLGIVATFTLALWALSAGRWGRYLLVFWLGTLNHENTLLLVPVALLWRARGRRPGARDVGWAALQVAGYAAIRLALFQLLPVTAAWQSGKVAYNLGLILHEPAGVMRTAVLLGAWLAIVIAGWRRLSWELRLALLLAPELLLVTVFLGQLNELRQFDALLPVLVVALLCVIGTPSGTRPESPIDPR